VAFFSNKVFFGHNFRQS